MSCSLLRTIVTRVGAIQKFDVKWLNSSNRNGGEVAVEITAANHKLYLGRGHSYTEALKRALPAAERAEPDLESCPELQRLENLLEKKVKISLCISNGRVTFSSRRNDSACRSASQPLPLSGKFAELF